MGDITAIEKEIAWLRMEVKQLREENQQFNSETPFIAGTEMIRKIVPPIPPFSLRATVSSSSMAGYLIIADAWNFILNKFIKENSVVLDIGCGVGKMARVLLSNPYIKRYIGFDNYEKSIQWCQDYLSPFGDGKFGFYFIDIFSEAYNPNGTIKGAEVIFPAGDNSVDFVFASSLFTHLLEEDAKHYLNEVKRVLKTGGTFLPTIHANPEPGKDYSGTTIRIDIDPEYFIKIAEESGLQLVAKMGILLGQDAFLFKS